MTPDQKQNLVAVIGWIILIAILLRRKRWRGSGHAHGTAKWADKRDLRKARMFSRKGLILGRTIRKRQPLRIQKFVHLSVFAPTGAGKGVSFVIPTLLTYFSGPVFTFDPKGELYKETANFRRARGQKCLRLDPFGVCGPGGDRFNPLDLINPAQLMID